MKQKKYLLILLFLIVLNFPYFVHSKSIQIHDVNIDCTIKQDTKVQWKEIRSIDFNGQFTFGSYDLPKQGYQWVKEITVGEKGSAYLFNETEQPGTFWSENLTEMHRLHFFFQAENELRAFDFNYLLEGAVDVYQDYGEFYWKLQGTGWGASVDHFQATIHLEKPVPIDEYMVWAHGPLNGEVTKIDDKTILLQVDHVPAYTFVEVRLLLPASYFQPDDNLPGEIKEKVLKEEAVWVEEANKIRDVESPTEPMIEEKTSTEKAIQKKQTFRIWPWIWNLVILGGSLFLLILGLFRYIKEGKELQNIKHYDYIRDPPDDIPPAEVGYIMSFNQYNPHTVQAVLLDLIRRKFIRQESGDQDGDGRDDIILSLEEENGIDELRDYEKTLLTDMIFRSQTYEPISQTTMKTLMKAIRTFPTLFYTISEKFKSEMKAAVRNHEYYDLKSIHFGEIYTIVCGLLIFPFFVIGIFLPKYHWISIPILLICIMIGKYGIPKRTIKGKEAYDRCTAFKKFLQDFTLLSTVEADSVIIWEKYLVYAVILGVSSRVINVLKVKLPKLDTSQSNLLQNTNPGNFMKFNKMSLAMAASMSHIRKPSNSSRSITRSSRRSSFSGKGGLFSGGGGRGGGGSGGGFG